MKYTVSDYYFLFSAVEQKANDVEDAYEGMCICMGCPVSMPCLLHAIRGLVAEGFLTVEPEGGVISAVTPIAVTAEGKKAAAISPIQKLFGESKAHKKNEARFCDTDYPNVPKDNLSADGDSFADCVTRLIRNGHVSHPMFEISGVEEGYLKLTVHHPNDGWRGYDDEDEADEEDYDPDAAALSYSASVTGTAEQIQAGLRDLIDTAYLLVTEPPRPRKVVLHGADRSLLISLANAANEQGLVSFRMTVAPIRFNRQRFVGKRDSDLDYAQCGDPIFIHEMASAEGFADFCLLHSAVAYPDLLTEEDFDKLSVIHQSTRN